MDFDDVPMNSNGPAYQRSELRVGPPLDYVAEKLRSSLTCLHKLASIEAPHEDARPAFYYALVSYLALNNMLAAANPPGFSDRLAKMKPDAFDQWLNAIDRGGSVSELAP